VTVKKTGRRRRRMEVEVSAIYLNLSPDKTRATLTCARSDGGNPFMLIMKMEVLEQLNMAANRATRRPSSGTKISDPGE
jgi:hypothetical protein